MAQKVSEVMTPVPVTVPPDCPLTEAARQMREHGIGDVLVTEGGHLRGMVTDRDIVVRAVADGRDMSTTTVADVCTADVISVHPGDDADTAVRQMREHAIRRVPVLDGDRPVGIVSIGDMAIQRDTRSVLSDISAQPPTT